MTSVWIVWYKVNPHRWSQGADRIIAIYDNQDDADNFVAIHPQYHYVFGKSEPACILEAKEIELNKVIGYWNPLFP